MKYKFTKSLNELRNEENVYGHLYAIDEDSGQQWPVICGHSGDKWLCLSCACKITRFQEFDNEVEVVESICPMCPLCGILIYPDSNWTIYKQAKDSLVAVHVKCLRGD